MARAFVTLAIFVALSSVDVSSSAAPLTSYRAPNECPDEASFIAQVERRAGEGAGASTQSISIVVEKSDALFVGELRLVTRAGRSTSRRVEGDTCKDVVDALGFATAVAIEEDRAETKAAVETNGTPPARPTPPPAESRPPTGLPERSQTKTAFVSLGIAGGIATGLAPNVGGTGRGFADVRLERPSIVSPSFRLSAAGYFAPDVAVGSARASFREAEGALDACPIRAASDRFSLAPCARLALGALFASGSGIAAARSDTRLWAAAAFLGRAGFDVTRSFAVELEAGPVVPLVRDRFTFLPSTDVHEVPNLAFAASMGARVTIW